MKFQNLHEQTNLEDIYMRKSQELRDDIGTGRIGDIFNEINRSLHDLDESLLVFSKGDKRNAEQSFGILPGELNEHIDGDTEKLRECLKMLQYVRTLHRIYHQEQAGSDPDCFQYVDMLQIESLGRILCYAVSLIQSDFSKRHPVTASRIIDELMSFSCSTVLNKS